ncbi:MFS transporter [Actinomadura sp. KC345]|uniref:MFS transporter n=1 Tax=Actinomadura sp. KC345 TaxID=2530371 RepID=UPI001AA003D1|nr:MFS transporter [Actinomadura sp. KC345]
MTLAIAGHVLAAGTVPAWAAVAGFCAVLGVTLMLAGHERSLATILGGLLGGQFALHTLFTAASDPVYHQLHGAAHGGVHGAAVPGGADVLLPVAHGSGGTAMTLAHTVAALVAAWWLRRGERSTWALARRVAAAADRPVRLLIALLTVEPAAPPRRTPVVTAAGAVMAVGRVLRHQVVRRGPPPRSRALARS